MQQETPCLYLFGCIFGKNDLFYFVSKYLMQVVELFDLIRTDQSNGNSLFTCPSGSAHTVDEVMFDMGDIIVDDHIKICLLYTSDAADE